MKRKMKAPEHLEGEALLEWHRVTTELNTDELKPADRALLVLWCETWGINQLAARQVNEHGAIVPAINKALGRSPHYQVYVETTTQLSKLADQLGLTRKARNYDRKNDDDLVGELE